MPNQDGDKLILAGNQGRTGRNDLATGILSEFVGSRVGKNSKIPLIRKPAKWCLNKLANYLTGQKIPDLNSGLRIMKKDITEM